MRQRKNNFGAIHFLSVIIPAYEQQNTIVKDVKYIDKVLNQLGYRYEIIVVNDGSPDDTYKRVQKLNSATIKVLGYDVNQGKGYAIRLGMMQARGDIIGFIDAGMDIHPNGFAMLLSHMEWYNADIIVGSKLHPVSKVNYPISRKILSWGYRWLTHRLFGFKIRDTQVGLKFFKRKVLKDVLPRLQVRTYAFDIEILAVAYMRGFTRIYEAPVEINFRNSTITTINVWKTIISMLIDTLRVFYRLKIRKYYTKRSVKTWKNAYLNPGKTPLTVERL